MVVLFKELLCRLFGVFAGHDIPGGGGREGRGGRREREGEGRGREGRVRRERRERGEGGEEREGEGKRKRERERRGGRGERGKERWRKKCYGTLESLHYLCLHVGQSPSAWRVEELCSHHGIVTSLPSD